MARRLALPVHVAIVPATNREPLRGTVMASFLKSLWNQVTGGGGAGPAAPAEAEAIEYNGYRIVAAPFPDGGQFQTAGRIEKEIGGVVKEHKFIRAEKHPSRDDAVSFSVTKGKQICDQQGDRMFD